jgi:hypothetical protein
MVGKIEKRPGRFFEKAFCPTTAIAVKSEARKVGDKGQPNHRKGIRDLDTTGKDFRPQSHVIVLRSRFDFVPVIFVAGHPFRREL